jgi:hypothetical protein
MGKGMEDEGRSMSEKVGGMLGGKVGKGEGNCKEACEEFCSKGGG